MGSLSLVFNVNTCFHRINTKTKGGQSVVNVEISAVYIDGENGQVAVMQLHSGQVSQQL